MEPEFDFDFLTPEYLLEKEELSRVRAIRRRVKALEIKKQVLTELKSPGHEKRIARANLGISNLDAELELISERVLKREVGLERYMVIHIVRYGGTERRLQVLCFSVIDRGIGTRLTWELTGRSLRKNQTLGSRHEGLCINFAKIYRRTLDGSWVRLHPKEEHQ
ncbi:hypothetical protein [Rhodoferax sp. GW822-FHT02A01]|uniref:hypothetical protein n=1 Tax=Rhodoferax sp. GW822-FHT02A01 TaxID=3141537 RepID=UPI00315D565F